MTEHPLVAAAVFAGVSDPRVLDAVASVGRADFVPPDSPPKPTATGRSRSRTAR